VRSIPGSRSGSGRTRHPPFDDLNPELLALARASLGAPPTCELARVRDEVIAGVPVRVYEHDQAPSDWRHLIHVHPAEASAKTPENYVAALTRRSA
jgi:hypothetical protein